MKKHSKILITGGHMTPALAVLEELKFRGHDNFLWVGHKHNQFGTKSNSAEYTTVRKLGIEFIDLKAGKLVRNWGSDWYSGVINLIKVPWGFWHALWIIIRHRPKLILSFGGYLALPLTIWGRILGKKVITHEQTVVTGLTNKIIPKFAHKVLISWPSSAKYYPPEKTIFTGNPLRKEIFLQSSNEFEFNNNLPVVYITGGNQGSHKINQAVFESLEQILSEANVIHQTGNNSSTNDWEQAQKLKQGLPENKVNRYIPQPFFYGDVIGEIFAKTSLIIARSGANTTMETLATGTLAIFIPIPWVTHNEQYQNAETAAQTGLATILAEAELTPESLYLLIKSSLQLLKEGKGLNGQPLEQTRKDARDLVKTNAASQIVDVLEKLLE